MRDRRSLDAFFTEARRPTLSEQVVADTLILGGWNRHPLSADDLRLAAKVAQELRGTDSHMDPSEAICRLIEGAVRGHQPFWGTHYLPAGRTRLLELAGSGADVLRCEDLLALPGQRFTVEFERTFNASLLPPGASPRLRLPLPIEDDQLRDLTIELESSSGTTEAKMLSGRIEARLLPDHAELVTLGARFGFTAHPGRPTLDAGTLPLETFLSPSEGLVEVTPVIRELAERLAPSSGDDEDVLRAFWDHLMEEMTCGPVPHDRLGNRSPATWVAEQGWYDCQLGAALLASLCRARNIPARLVGGYCLYESSPGEHYWAEVWLREQGWTPFDLLSWDLSNGGSEEPWRDLFFGATDYRIKTQSFPDRFVGPIGIPLPQEWHRFSRITPEGLEVEMTDIASGQLIFRDRIKVDKS